MAESKKIIYLIYNLIYFGNTLRLFYCIFLCARNYEGSKIVVIESEILRTLTVHWIENTVKHIKVKYLVCIYIYIYTYVYTYMIQLYSIQLANKKSKWAMVIMRKKEAINRSSWSYMVVCFRLISLCVCIIYLLLKLFQRKCMMNTILFEDTLYEYLKVIKFFF